MEALWLHGLLNEWMTHWSKLFVKKDTTINIKQNKFILWAEQKKSTTMMAEVKNKGKYT